MEIIDCHIHTVYHDRKGWLNLAYAHGVEEASKKLLESEMKRNGVVNAITITVDDNFDLPTPLLLDEAVKQAGEIKGLLAVCGINPLKAGKKEQAATEKALADGLLVGLKIFPGYTYFYPNDKIYHPFYRLAEKYGVPVIAHCGDVLKAPNIDMPEPRLKYSLPLHMDEAAVSFPGVDFIIAHLGCPWIRDTAELIYKNQNVFADLSGLVHGNVSKTRYVKHTIRDIQFAFSYGESPDKLLYGSDWPLVKMADYIKMIKESIPKKCWEKVFYLNAKKLFNV